MFVRLELADPDDFDLSLNKLRASFPKVAQVFFPFKKMKGGSWYGFNFYKTDLLLDWKSIEKWCMVESASMFESNSCSLLCSPKAAEVLLPSVPMVASLIRSKHEFSCDLSFILAKRKSKLQIQLSAEEDSLAVDFGLSGLLTGHAKTTEIMVQVWKLAQKKYPLLKQADVNFKERIQFTAPKKSETICANENGIKIKFSGSAGIQSALKKAYELASEIRGLFEDWYTFFALQLMPDEAPSIAKAFKSWCAESSTHFDGTYHPSFHPDQVLKEFPKEGFWHLPLFDVQLGRQFYDMGTLHLVQTPKERFFEMELSSEEELIKLKQWLKPKRAFQTYDGPTEKRWNLHKLKKKK